MSRQQLFCDSDWNTHVVDLLARRARWKAPPNPEGSDRGYYKLYFDHVMQAEDGCDFDFMLPAATRPT